MDDRNLLIDEMTVPQDFKTDDISEIVKILHKMMDGWSIFECTLTAQQLLYNLNQDNWFVVRKEDLDNVRQS